METKKQLGRMGTNEDRLRWALWFAQADLSQWREGDWLNALEDAVNVAYEREQPPVYAQSLVIWWRGKSVDDAKSWLTPLRAALRDFFENVHKGEDAKVPGKVSCVFLTMHRPRRLRVRYEPSVPESGMQNYPKGFIAETLLQVGDFLTRINMSRLKQCPECNRLFLAVRRQRFDTPECSLRDRTRRFHQKKRQARSRK